LEQEVWALLLQLKNDSEPVTPHPAWLRPRISPHSPRSEAGLRSPLG
jgi:hypothetical protein